MATSADPRLHELFDDQARVRPDALAAVHGDRSVTYTALRSRSLALAARLHAAGVVRGDRVGVVGGRSIDALAAFLAVLRLGAAYVPLDDSAPPARQQAMAEDAGVQVAIVLPGAQCRIRRLRTRIDAGAPAPAAAAPPPEAAGDAGDAAYVMFTSGSSGRPKAVAVPHRGVVRLTDPDARWAPPGPGDRVLHAYGLSSDASTIEIWAALATGAALVLIEREELLSVPALEERIARHGVHVAFLTTSVFHAVARTRPEALRPLRFASAGGEALDPALASRVQRACPATALVNFYGPTENTVVTTAHLLGPIGPDDTAVPIGRPITGTTCHVLRADGTAAGPGEEGELLVGGTGLALGYLGDARLEAERFVDDPRAPGTRLYRTGDRAVLRDDGDLEFRGRTDRQLKIRGHRIELDEIEAHVRAHPGVGEAVVDVADGGADPGRLSAWLTPADPAAPVPVDAVRQALAAWLPAATVPARFVEMAELPINRAGKVDRARLAAAEDRVRAAEGAAAPGERASGLAGRLAAVWETVLRTRPGPGDDFFALGGDSLLAAETVTRTLAVLGIGAEHGTALVRALLAEPTLAAFAEAAGQVVADGSGGATAVDWADEARLGFVLPDPVPAPHARWEDPRDVLLTGASGFVGAFLLDRLLSSTTARVHCPVRARDADHARRRIRANLERYGLDPAAANSPRVVCFPGDLTEDGMGLAKEHQEELSAVLDLIVHSAAHVNFLYPYEALRRANVDSVRTLARIAAPRRVPLHFLSTIAVIAGFGGAGERHVDEDRPLDHADLLTMGYAESKWVAERVLMDAADQGLPVAVHRPYEITGDIRTGACNTETAICSLFKTAAETGTAPDIALPMDLIPVDFLADAIVHIATRRRTDRTVYHLTNPDPAPFSAMIGRMRAAGIAVETRPYADWVAELVRYVADHPTAATAPFVSLCVDRSNKGDISVKEMYFEEHFPAIGRRNVEAALADSGLRCPPVDAALLDRYLDYFFRTGYLERPSAGPAAGPTKGTGDGRAVAL